MSYIVLEALFLKGTSHIKWESIEIIEVINIIGALVVAVLILRFILSPYIVLDGASVMINHAFTKDDFQLGDIVDINMEDGNFTLKNGKKVKFNSYMISKKGMELLKDFFAGTAKKPG
jgi:hypothetical protein